MANDLASLFGPPVYPPMQATPERTYQAILRDRQAQLEQQRIDELNQSIEPPPALADLFTMPPRELRGDAIFGRTPGWRENTQQTSGAIAQAISGKPRSEAARDTGSVMSATDWLPVTGDVSDAMDAGQSFSEGNYGEAGLGALLAAVPLIPARKTINKLKDVKREGARKTVSDIVDAVMHGTPKPRSGISASKAAGGLGLKPAKEAALIRGPEEDFTPAAADVLAGAAEPVDPRAGAWQAPEAPQPGHNNPPPDGSWGDPNRPPVIFEGVEPSQFTPSQWYRFGQAQGSRVPLGPQDEEAWYASLKPFKTADGSKTYKIPGGLLNNEPFTYWDDLYMKSQAINPAELDEATRTAIHNRTVAGKSEPPGGWQDKDIANQFQLGMTSPNNPLTPNEFAVAASHIKGPEDLKRLAESSAMDYGKSSNYLGTQGEARVNPKIEGTPYSSADRQAASLRIMDTAGVGAGERGGLGAGGSADWTRISDMAQMLREKPEFFRFRGAQEGGATHEENWANFVDRIITQVPGLKAKTGSFSSVWQDPAHAGISALDRHMLAIIRDNVFETPEQAAKWGKSTVKKWNDSVKAYNKVPENKVKRKAIAAIDDLSTTPGGTSFFNDEMFATINNPARTKIRDAKGNVRPEVPAHLHPDVAGYVKEPTHSLEISPGYKRGLQDVTKKGARPGSTGLFSDQWYQWDPQRQRFEPHEIMNPGLADVQRMNPEQLQRALDAHNEAGYLNYSKDEAGKLQPVRPVPFADGAGDSPGLKRMAEMLGNLNPSRLAAFQHMLTTMGLGGAGLAAAGVALRGGRDEKQKGGT